MTFVEGWTAHPAAWPEDVLPLIGGALRNLHDVSVGFQADDALWQPWFGRDLGGSARVIGHCDTGPWNILARADNTSVTFIDWETAGPVDPLVELAQACWLNAQLHDDQIASTQDLPDAQVRARHARSILDGYGAKMPDRMRVLELMIEVAIADAADQARGITPDETNPEQLWAIAWRVRSAAWITRHRELLTRAFQ